ncbi:hypothetical protein KGP36_02630 [Patescibacteria group bacterium]|nr:hypothetical protein [Patescibacteria group bacterium]
MANIFAGTELPQWMQSVRNENAILGESIGTVLAGGLLGLQKNEDGDGMKGFQQGLAEARMNQADPMWRVKEKNLEAQAVSRWAMAASQWQQLDATNKDMAAWTSQDLPAISKFQEELKTNPDAVPPVVESSKGIQVIGQLEKQQMMLQAQRLRQDNAKINLENQKTSTAFDQAVAAAPVGVGSAIDELPNQGWNIDRQGRRTTPSTAALKIYNDAMTEGGKYPERAFGYKPNAAEVARIRGEEQRKVEEKRGEVRGQVEAQRQENRKELERMKQEGRIDVEKLKQLGRTDGKGAPLGEKEFINRHFNTVWTTLRKNAPDDETPAMTAAKAERLLSGVYHRVDQRNAAAGIPSKTMPFTPPASVSTNEAKQTVPGATNDISFDDFQKWKSNTSNNSVADPGSSDNRDRKSIPETRSVPRPSISNPDPRQSRESYINQHFNQLYKWMSRGVSDSDKDAAAKATREDLGKLYDEIQNPTGDPFGLLR